MADYQLYDPSGVYLFHVGPHFHTKSVLPHSSHCLTFKPLNAGALTDVCGPAWGHLETILEPPWAYTDKSKGFSFERVGGATAHSDLESRRGRSNGKTQVGAISKPFFASVFPSWVG